MPMNRKAYPHNWEEISLRIRQRDEWKCAFCGVGNGEIHPVTGGKVTLTVAHLHNPDPMDVRDENLASLCNSCHNRLDAPMRRKHAAETRRQRKIKAGQLELLPQEKVTA
jgi:5-methylcytosine-specific restriction endonuclease McrA